MAEDVRYYGSPRGKGPWVTPEEALEIARLRVEQLGGAWIGPIDVVYSQIRLIGLYVYEVHTLADRHGGGNFIRVNARDGSIIGHGFDIR